MSAELVFKASDGARSAIERLGRSEDVKLSPSGRRLAVAGFRANRITVFEIEISGSGSATTVSLGHVLEISTPGLRLPHGVSFLDEETLVVTNRGANVLVLDAPTPRSPVETRVVAPRHAIFGGSAGLVATPGSVSVFPLDDETVELLVCNNYVHHVTRHVLERRRGYSVVSDEIFLKKGLDVPDGVCVSPDGRWIAVSNHNMHCVFMYERTAALNPDSTPDGVLRNVICPHGVRFTPDQQCVLVADASAPYVNVYKLGTGTWAGSREPAGAYPVMDDAVFTKGRFNMEEGGPKGIDIDSEMRVLVTTSEFQSLAFFDLSKMLQQASSPGNRHGRYVRWRLEKALFRRTGFIAGRRA